MDRLSSRGRFNVTKTIAQLPQAMLENDSKGTNGEHYKKSIDLSMAENWLIRDEVLSISKPAIEKYFHGDVSPSIWSLLAQNAADEEDDTSIFPCQKISGAIHTF